MTTNDITDWTPEARATRAIQREAARVAMRACHAPWAPALFVDAEVDRLFPAPPPEVTYGRVIRPPHNVSQPAVRRGSDGGWEYLGNASREWHPDPTLSDAYVRAMAAEVPLTDAECDALSLGSWSGDTARRGFIRAAFARVLRGEVTGLNPRARLYDTGGAMIARYYCTECRYVCADDERLTAPNPFDPGETLTGCPHCRTAGSLVAACDVPRCSRQGTMGTPTPSGYRVTCWQHKPPEAEND